MKGKQNPYPNNFAEARKRKGYSQKYVAARIGVSRKTLCNYEAGVCKPSVDRLIDMCNLYEVKAEYLCADLFRRSKVRITKEVVQHQAPLPGMGNPTSSELEDPAFAPKTTSQFIALRMSQRLNHVSDLKRYLVLFEHYSLEFLIDCYRHAVSIGDTGEHFFAALQQLTQ